MVSKALRRISKHMPSFPEELLYVHKDNGGMGFSRLSTIVQLQKLSLMQRMAEVGGASGHAMGQAVKLQQPDGCARAVEAATRSLRC